MRYLTRRVIAWVLAHLAAPTGSEYDRIDQELTRRTPARWQ
jgi:hypothetical protein